jgi:hypothetical protein
MMRFGAWVVVMVRLLETGFLPAWSLARATHALYSPLGFIVSDPELSWVQAMFIGNLGHPQAARPSHREITAATG